MFSFRIFAMKYIEGVIWNFGFIPFQFEFDLIAKSLGFCMESTGYRQQRQFAYRVE